MKVFKNISFAIVALFCVVALFRFTKVKPDDNAVCLNPKLECAVHKHVIKPFVDTASIVSAVAQRIKQEKEDEFLTQFAGRRLWGIDISKYQTNINWSLMVKKNKPDFVFVKATEGTTIVDKMYRSHKRNLEKYNVLHGAYHFMSFSSSGRSQALKFIRHARLKKGNMVPVLDVEYTRRRMPNKYKVRREIRSFCRTIEKYYGVKPIIYTHPHLYSNYLKGHFNSNPLWICDYRRRPRHNWVIWQHTSKARIYGYRGRLDKNVMKSDRATLKKLIML